MISNIKPLYDKILVQRVQDEKTSGGIIIPDTAKEKGQTGKVIAVGNGKLTQNGKIVPLTVKQGDTIFFGKYSGTEIDENHLIIREEEVLGIQYPEHTIRRQ